ncbi:MAG: hypothetical protein M0R40_03060 [Firmicutes bacterium]|nr:hypothetical protein [Bacillota bacterium]
MFNLKANAGNLIDTISAMGYNYIEDNLPKILSGNIDRREVLEAAVGAHKNIHSLGAE